ncbi:hypothetical protein BGZ76_009463 [Entomortierella beljakovae]|nr:hypothetical protein BGZ76_009463 [Entomortierella beljakovae]
MDSSTTKAFLVSAVAITATAVLIQAVLYSNGNTRHNGNNKKGSKPRNKVSNQDDFNSPIYVTGLVNIGNTCFMNAVLQALASLPSLRSYLEARKEVGHAQDSITLALCETIEMLNTIHKRPTSKRLVRMVNTVKAKAAHVLTSQQQYSCSLEECLDSFINLDTLTDYQCRKCTVMKASKDLERIIEQGKKTSAEIEKRRLDSDGSTSNQSNNMDVKTEPGNDSTRTKSENKPRNSRRRSSANLSSKPKVKLAEMEGYKKRVDLCLANDIEMDLSPLELTPVCSKRTTKHSMIAKPPQALCLHLNRSLFTPSGQMAKNPCRVHFDSKLDFTRFTTSGHLNTVATRNMSRRGSVVGGSTFKGVTDSGFSSRTGSSHGMGGGSNSGLAFPRHGGINQMTASTSFNSGFSNTRTMHGFTTSPSTTDEHDEISGVAEDKVIYRLWAVIVHLGSHNSGHFVTYRRIPSSPESTSFSFINTDDVDDIDSCESSEKWWRISDEDVQIVDWSLVKNTEAYMLFFEKET